MPCLLTPEQKECRKEVSTDCLPLYKHNPTKILCQFITADETWVHHNTPATKQQSKQWTVKGEPTPKKAKTIPSAGKVHGIIFIDYIEREKQLVVSIVRIIWSI